MNSQEKSTIPQYSEEDLLNDFQKLWRRDFPNNEVPDTIDVDVKGLGNICRKIGINYAYKREEYLLYSKGQIAGGIAWALFDGRLTLRSLTEKSFDDLEKEIPFEDYEANPNTYPKGNRSIEG